MNIDTDKIDEAALTLRGGDRAGKGHDWDALAEASVCPGCRTRSGRRSDREAVICAESVAGAALAPLPSDGVRSARLVVGRICRER